MVEAKKAKGVRPDLPRDLLKEAVDQAYCDRVWGNPRQKGIGIPTVKNDPAVKINIPAQGVQ